MNLRFLRTYLLSALITLTALVAAASTPLPTDLQLVPSHALPGRGATWWSVQRWGTRPGSPVNWCAGRTDVLYYRSTTFGTNKVIIDDTLVDYTQTQAAAVSAASMETTDYMEPSGPPFGPNDIWLDIKFHGNSTNNLVDVTLHGATNGVWQLLTKANLDDTNAWTALEIQEQKGTSNYLTFGPYPDKSSAATFFRAELLTNLFFVVATNINYPAAIDYHPERQSLVISYNPPYDPTNTFGIIDENAFLTNWSGLGWIEGGGYTVRFATVKAAGNGFNEGDLFFGSGIPRETEARIGWLYYDGMASNINWTSLSSGSDQVTGLYVDQTGIWNNDLVAVTSDDVFHSLASHNVWRINSRTETNLITSITASHLDGLLTLPDDARYGPWAGKLLTADPNYSQIFAVDPDGTYKTNYLSISADSIRLVETNQPLYCLGYQDDTSLVLKVPAAFFRQWQGDILMMQSGIVVGDPILSIVHWNSTNSSFEVRDVRIWDYLPSAYVDHLSGIVFAPIELRPVP